MFVNISDLVTFNANYENGRKNTCLFVNILTSTSDRIQSPIDITCTFRHLALIIFKSCIILMNYYYLKIKCD